MKLFVRHRTPILCLLAAALFLAMQSAAWAVGCDYRGEPACSEVACGDGICHSKCCITKMVTDEHGYTWEDNVMEFPENCETCWEDCQCEWDEICDYQYRLELNGRCWSECSGPPGMTGCWMDDSECQRLLEVRPGYMGVFYRDRVDWGCMRGKGQCGDGKCEEGENCEMCPNDCPCDMFVKCDPSYLYPDAHGCIAAERICDDGLDDDGDWATDCADSDCFESPKCAKIAIFLDSDVVVADGEGHIDFEVMVTTADGEPAEGQQVSVRVETDVDEWEGKIGAPEPENGSTSGDGSFHSTYTPPAIYSIDPIPATLYAKHDVSGNEASADITIEPAPMVSIGVIEAIQVLRGAAMVAGKKMVVMVGISSLDEKVFEKSDEYDVFLDLVIGETAEFSPQNNFERINIAEPTGTGGTVVRQANALKHVEYFDLFRDIEEGGELVGSDLKWLFYEFYVDPKDTRYQGQYWFDAKLYMEKIDPETGQVKRTDFNGKGVRYWVYPSPFMSVKMVPMGVGLWHTDFCKYCVRKRLSQLVEPGWYKYVVRPIRYRIWGKPEVLVEAYDWECTPQMFSYTFDGVVDLQRINKVLNKNNSLFREACKYYFDQKISQSGLQQLAGQSPIRDREGLTAKDRYLAQVAKQKEYFRATMPVAEENIFFQTSQSPFESPLISARTSSPWLILYGMYHFQGSQRRYSYSLEKIHPEITEIYAKMAGFDRVVGVVPTNFAVSNVDMDPEGYMSSIANPTAVLISADLASYEVMAHEILHTYCAIDEYENLAMTGLKTMTTPLNCAEGYWRINSKGPDDRGTRVKNGYWVEKRRFKGTPYSPQYSLMGNEITDPSERWITEDLYYGVGVKLGAFPSTKEGAHGKVQR